MLREGGVIHYLKYLCMTGSKNMCVLFYCENTGTLYFTFVCVSSTDVNCVHGVGCIVKEAWPWLHQIELLRLVHAWNGICLELFQ